MKVLAGISALEDVVEALFSLRNRYMMFPSRGVNPGLHRDIPRCF